MFVLLKHRSPEKPSDVCMRFLLCLAKLKRNSQAQDSERFLQSLNRDSRAAESGACTPLCACLPRSPSPQPCPARPFPTRALASHWFQAVSPSIVCVEASTMRDFRKGSSGKAAVALARGDVGRGSFAGMGKRPNSYLSASFQRRSASAFRALSQSCS